MYENMDDFVVYSPVSDISDTVERSSPSQRDKNDDNHGGDGANRDNHRQHHHHAHYRNNHHQYRDHQSSNGEHSRPQRELNPYDRNSRHPQRRERETPPGQDEYYHHHRPHQPHHHHVDNEYRGDSEDYRRPRRESPLPPPPPPLPSPVARRDKNTVDRNRQRQQRRPAAPLSEPSSTLVIKNMPIRVTEREISDTFSTLPGFRECARRSNRWGGHGVYIEFDTIDSAQKAFHSVQSTRFHGQRNPLNVDYHGRDTADGGTDRHNSLKRRHDDPSRVEERRPGDRYKEDVEEPARYKRRSISPARSEVDERRDGILPEPRSSERDRSHHRPSVDQAGYTRRDNSESLDRHQHHHYHPRPSHEENMRRDTRNDDRRYDGRDNEMRYVERRRSDDDGPPTHEHSMDGRYARDRRPPYPEHFNNTTSPMQYGAPPSGPTVNRDGDLIHRLVSHVMPYRSFDEYADVVGMTPTGRPTTLYVCNIPQDIRERELHLFFRMSLPFPAVRSVRMIQNSRSKWIAFIDFSEYHAAMMAMHKLNGYVIDPTLPEGIKIDLDTKSK